MCILKTSTKRIEKVKLIVIIIVLILIIFLMFGSYFNINKSCMACNVETEKTEVKQEETLVDNINVPQYTQEELNLLARVIYSEAGSDWITDEHQLAVGSVVLNRIKSNKFPNTMYEVVYQKKPAIQYACTVNGMINKTPNERAIKNAEYLLTYGSTIPENVIWQSQAPQGKGTWKVIQGHYFCY